MIICSNFGDSCDYCLCKNDCYHLGLGVSHPLWCFTGSSDGKEFVCSAGDSDSILGLGRSPGEGNGNPFQYSCLENSMNRGYRKWGCKESDMTEQLTLPL